MFSRSQNKSFSKSQKPGKSSSSFSKESGISKHRRHQEPRRRPTTSSSTSTYAAFADQTLSPIPNPNLTSAIVTLVVGRDQRLFAAHSEILCASPFFQRILQNLYYDPVATPSSAAFAVAASPTPSAVSTSSASSRRITLPDDEPEIFSCVLEYLYKGDYYPRLLHNKHRNSWELEQSMDNGDGHGPEASIFQHPVDGDLLKDTVIYCSAEKFGLDELKRIALRKQGLQSGIQCATILSSARYAYANTPDTDSKLRAHYLALIIRSRNTFKRSGTMQLEMYNGGTQLFFDLFVALCNHVDDISSAQASPHSNRHF